MFKLAKCWPVFLVAAALGTGCHQDAPSRGGNADPALAGERDKYLLKEEPAGARGVLDARKDARDGDEVVVVGRVGGSSEPLGKDRAYFTLVDPSYLACGENNKEDDCKTPWDYCCTPADELARATALVKVVDAQGKTVGHAAEALLGVKPLRTVVVRGKAKRDDHGNLTVLAEGVYVRPSPQEGRP
jgi:hypothetical protein